MKSNYFYYYFNHIT